MLAMGDGIGHDSFLWNDDQSWAFPILQVEENGGKTLIDSGKILMGMGQQQATEEPAPAPVAAAKGKTRITGKRGGGGDQVVNVESDDHELHIWTERERRKKMRNMFATLHALIPHLHPRVYNYTPLIHLSLISLQSLFFCVN